MRAPDPQFEPDDAALDRLLGQARWEPPTAEQEARLRQGWLALNRRRRIGPVVWCAAAAAIALIVAGPLMIRLRSAAVVSSTVVPLPNEKYLTMITDEPARKAISRSATPYERLAVMAQPRKRQASMPPATAPSPAPSLAELQTRARSASAPARRQAMQMLLARNDADGIRAFLDCITDPIFQDDAKAALAALPQPPREALLREFDSPLISTRRAAAMALGAICDARLAQRLEEMVETGTHRREALAALLAAKNDSTAAILASAAERNSTVDSQIRAIQSDSSEFN